MGMIYAPHFVLLRAGFAVTVALAMLTDKSIEGRFNRMKDRLVWPGARRNSSDRHACGSAAAAVGAE